ncbi:MAG: shikimate dehydrogenase [Spirochaetes bacterium GWF1_31_7]|nr:MAG: shikimate dehydrogenase [Spirochaetes bacterium GWE1_32_154]OHD44875.1 MAG: shikimate dehydrogenase [Spirochaetes bacterium GWE2_31_10]OHD47666.1 MAG: shikimate dehydrogenase [Spirochaetes bacterium GWF1_31_7]HBD94866.1 shikimate dehydrogenase [Spirochaetia bacterium]
MINSATALYCIIGNPVSHSKSPHIHNAAFKYHNINAVYLAFDIDKDNFNEAITGLKRLKELKGLNITVPHKVNILPFIDKLDSTATTTGSVNTIKNDNGTWIGYNTDWYGVLKTLENNKINQDVSVLIIGSGGATPAVIYALQQYGIKKISITNRTEENADILAGKFGISKINYTKYKNTISEHNLIINTTTLTFNDFIDTYDSKTIYYDLKYYKNFDKPNIKYINGKEMLLYQAAMAYTIWTNKESPIEIMKLSLNEENK